MVQNIDNDRTRLHRSETEDETGDEKESQQTGGISMFWVVVIAILFITSKPITKIGTFHVANTFYKGLKKRK